MFNREDYAELLVEYIKISMVTGDDPRDTIWANVRNRHGDPEFISLKKKKINHKKNPLDQLRNSRWQKVLKML